MIASAVLIVPLMMVAERTKTFRVTLQRRINTTA
jgi:hypothetical protein